MWMRLAMLHHSALLRVWSTVLLSPIRRVEFFGLWLWVWRMGDRALLTTIRDRKHPPFRAQLDTCPLLANKEQPPPLPASACARGGSTHTHARLASAQAAGCRLTGSLSSVAVPGAIAAPAEPSSRSAASWRAPSAPRASAPATRAPRRRPGGAAGRPRLRPSPRRRQRRRRRRRGARPLARRPCPPPRSAPRALSARQTRRGRRRQQTPCGRSASRGAWERRCPRRCTPQSATRRSL
mmetsp:Transcript_5008/g.16721  ORF Transcript_5008/g.16721 Transcript_5008/m.16721 type:complete len:238 (-) Transcript_5008:401-1114(-)